MSALRAVRRLAEEEGLLAVILPAFLMPELSGHSAYDDGIPLLAPRRAKGLEFDHVVVVEPALIAEGEARSAGALRRIDPTERERWLSSTPDRFPAAMGAPSRACRERIRRQASRVGLPGVCREGQKASVSTSARGIRWAGERTSGHGSAS